VIDAVVAAAAGDQNSTDALEAAFNAITGWATLIAVLRRIIAGERGETLLDGLTETDAAIVGRVLERVAEA
jgi:hypothetical protein